MREGAAVLCAAALAALAASQAGPPGPLPGAALEDSVPYVGAAAPAGGGRGGEGVYVAVIDTGVDAAHPDLAGSVEAAVSLAPGGAWDSDGHGTAVAGVIAADGALRGVAPGARILSYKVSDDGADVLPSRIADAIGAAVRDGADVVNISLGVNRTHHEIDLAIARAHAAGVLVVAAAGNDGPAPSSIGSPGSSRHAVTVGASYNNVSAAAAAAVSAGGAAYEAVPMRGAPALEGELRARLSLGGHATAEDLAAGGHEGAIVLAERGGPPGRLVYFSEKEGAAARAGAAALLVYNSAPGPYLGDLVHASSPPGYEPSIPALSLSRADGLALLGPAAAGAEASVEAVEGPDRPAAFSSRGPASPFYLKPDLLAPGAPVNTTAPGGGYRESAGTSFAAPHVSGAAALLLQRSPGLSPQDVRSLLATTADPAAAGHGRDAAGAGRLNVSRALAAGAVLDPPYLVVDVSPARPEGAASLHVRRLDGAPAGAGAEIDMGGSPARASAEASGGHVAVRASAPPGLHEGVLRVSEGGSEYSVPVLVRSAEGSISASAAPGRVLASVSHPGGWSYARVYSESALTGLRDAASARPGQPAELLAGPGPHDLRAVIHADGGRAEAFGSADVPGGEGAPERGPPARPLAAAAAACAALCAAAWAGRR